MKDIEKGIKADRAEGVFEPHVLVDEDRQQETEHKATKDEEHAK
jgi:hypothetical protein